MPCRGSGDGAAWAVHGTASVYERQLGAMPAHPGALLNLLYASSYVLEKQFCKCSHTNISLDANNSWEDLQETSEEQLFTRIGGKGEEESYTPFRP